MMFSWEGRQAGRQAGRQTKPARSNKQEGVDEKEYVRGASKPGQHDDETSGHYPGETMFRVANASCHTRLISSYYKYYYM